MEKRLEDLTKEEWDNLFPVELVAHNDNWTLIFETEKALINKRIGYKVLSIEHVGSTSVPRIMAKDYIDISIELEHQNLFNKEIIEGLEALGYHFFRQVGKEADYMVFVKGYNLNGQKEQVFHIHACPTGHSMLGQVLFRDYLRSQPKRALAYEQLKTKLAAQYKNDRMGYRIAKNDFIAETMKLAQAQ